MADGEPKIHLTIIGGGIAGLALAAGLYRKHKHIDFRVFEGTKVYKDVGAGLAIHNNGISAMGLITPELQQVYYDKGLLMGEADLEMSTQVIIAQGEFEGELVAQLGRVKGRKTVSRADLLQGLCELIPADRITFGKRLKSVEQDSQTVELTFEDGSTVQSDLVIAADGIHSPIRKYILGPDHPATEPVNHDRWKIYSRTVSMEEAIKHDIPERWTREVPILLGRGGYLNSMPLDKGTKLSAAVVVHGVDFDADGEGPPLDIKGFQEYSADAQRIVRLVAEDPQSWPTIDHDPAPTYFRKRVAVTGDAAHATFA